MPWGRLRALPLQRNRYPFRLEDGRKIGKKTSRVLLFVGMGAFVGGGASHVARLRPRKTPSHDFATASLCRWAASVAAAGTVRWNHCLSASSLGGRLMPDPKQYVHVDERGVMRVAASRVMLDSIVAAF